MDWWVSVPWVPRMARALTKRDCLTSYFIRAFTLALLCPKELHVDLMLNPMLSY